MEISAITLHHAIAPEDQARAEFYALQARLYAAPPDAPMLALIGASEPWAGRWRQSAGVGVEQAHPREPGDGRRGRRPGVHRSVHRRRPQRDRPACVALDRRGDRGTAAGRRARRPGPARVSAASGGRRSTKTTSRRCAKRCAFSLPGPATASRPTWRRNARSSRSRSLPGSFDCCNAILQSPVANYYRWVAQLTSLFLAVERDSLAID